MKKTGKMLGAVVLSACLAMGTVPAFATYSGFSTEQTTGGSVEVGETEYFDQSVDGQSASGETTVDVYYRSKVISAQIPINIAIVASGTATTAGKILAPDSDSYKITNTGIKGEEYYADVKVSKVVAKKTASSDWNLKTTSEEGALVLKLRGGVGATIDLEEAKENNSPVDWNIYRGEELGLELSGTSQPTSDLYEATTQNTTKGDNSDNRLYLNEKAFQIFYTIAMVSEA